MFIPVWHSLDFSLTFFTIKVGLKGAGGGGAGGVKIILVCFRDEE